jgi:hypothetical protein
MKYLLPILLLPSLAFAEPPEGQMKTPSFEQYKSTMQPVLQDSLPAIKETRACMNKASSKEEFVKCVKIMEDKARATRNKMGIPEDKTPTTKVPDDFEWNAKTKESILKDIDRSIQYNSALQECLGKSKTDEEMGNCMGSKAPASKE